MDHILVLVKQVPATENVTMDEETGTMVRKGLEAVINPLDLYAVEEAVRLKEASNRRLCVSVLSMGPPSAVDAIKEAIAMGCDDGVLLSGREFAGSDTWATAFALSKAAHRLGVFDLILCGERATDGETGQVGPMVGAMLELPVLTYVSHIEVFDEETLAAHRAIEGGHEIVRCPLPALVSVVKEINEPRLPTLSGKMRARRTEIPVFDANDIDVDLKCLGLSGSPTRVVKVSYPSLTRSGEIVSIEESSVDTCVDRLMKFLEKSGVIWKG